MGKRGPARGRYREMVSKRYAQVLVFVTSGAVLVLEILAGRLLAPFVGVSLETFTGIIGTILAGIALGASAGGHLADRHEPNRLIGPALILGGVLAWLSIPVVSILGPGFGRAVPAIVLLSFFGFFPSALVLSAISPMVAKLRLQTLDETGEVVGGLSAAGTAGALFGTFFTGFVLVAAAPTRPIVIAVGAGLVAWGVLFTIRRGGSRPPVAAAAIGLIVVVLAATAPDPCEFESAYACGRVVAAAGDPSLRFLHLDTLRHGAVDLADPSHLEFRYINIIGDVIDALPDGPIDALHVGGGAFSVPGYVNATRPGSANLVLEIDPLLVDVGRDELGLVTGEDLQVITGDARTTIGDLPTNGYDVIVGDVFGGLAVPWHLTTTEFMAEIDRVLRPGGIYVMNLIDGGQNRFVEAELATLAVHFERRAVVVPPEWPSERPANQIVIASHRALPTIDVDPEHGTLIVDPGDVDDFTGGAPVLRDDYAPVEQLAANL